VTEGRPTLRSIAIVGGGWAGLAAGVWLARKGAAITLFEAGRDAGGRARRVVSNTWEIDNGAHILLGAYTETLDLIEAVSPGSVARHFLRLPLTLNFPGHFRLALPPIPAPLNLLFGLLATGGVSIATKWSIAKLMARIKYSAPTIPETQTVEQLIGGQTREAIDYIWGPLCLSALNTPLKKASAHIFANVLSDALTGPHRHADMLLPRTNLTEIFPTPAILDIRKHGGTVELGCRISRISPTRDGIVLDAPSQRRSFDQVILACAPYQASRLLASIDGAQRIRNKLDSFHYQPIVTSYLDYPETVRLPSPLIGLCDHAAHFAFDQGYTHNRLGRLTVVTSAEHLAPDDGREGRIRHTHRALECALGSLPPPRAWRIIEEKRATFECVATLDRPGHMTNDPRIYLAGDYTEGRYPATLEGAVQSGVQCAQLAWSKS
jgi:hydroxysqualene dehydroxylase